VDPGGRVDDLGFGAAELLRILLAAGEEGRAAGIKRAGKYFLSALACMAASLLNPYTYHLHVHVWQYLRDPYLAARIMDSFRWISIIRLRSSSRPCWRVECWPRRGTHGAGVSPSRCCFLLWLTQRCCRRVIFRFS